MTQEMVRSEHVSAQPFVQRFEPPACATDPAGKCRTAEIDALTGKDLRLPIERSVSTADANLPFNVEPEVFAKQVIRQRLAARLYRRNLLDDTGLVFPDAGNVAADVFQAERERIRIDANQSSLPSHNRISSIDVLLPRKANRRPVVPQHVLHRHGEAFHAPSNVGISQRQINLCVRRNNHHDAISPLSTRAHRVWITAGCAKTHHPSARSMAIIPSGAAKDRSTP
jgi:hypothetical protein